MQTSAAGITLISQFEGWVPHVYPDQAGLPTIGYGHLITRQECGAPPECTLAQWMALAQAKYPTPLTIEEGRALLQKDAAVAEASVQKRVKLELNQAQFDALVSFTFNVGDHNLQSSTLLRRINAGRFGEAQAEFAKWNKVRNPKTGLLEVSAGLTKRREREAAHFASGS